MPSSIRSIMCNGWKRPNGKDRLQEWMEAGTYAGGNTCNARNDMTTEERREERGGNARDAEVRGEVGFAATSRRRSWSSRPCLSSLASSRAEHAAAGNVIAPVSSAGFHYHSCLGPAVALKNGCLIYCRPTWPTRCLATLPERRFSAFPTKAKYPLAPLVRFRMQFAVPPPPPLAVLFSCVAAFRVRRIPPESIPYLLMLFC